jgi:hypothetical protein
LKEFAKHFRLFGVFRHAIHLSLQLLSRNWSVRVILQRLRFAQVLCNFRFQFRLRHHGIKRWLGAGILLWPDAVTPVNFLNRSLIRYALRECQRSRGNLR